MLILIANCILIQLYRNVANDFVKDKVYTYVLDPTFFVKFEEEV